MPAHDPIHGASYRSSKQRREITSALLRTNGVRLFTIPTSFPTPSLSIGSGISLIAVTFYGSGFCPSALMTDIQLHTICNSYSQYWHTQQAPWKTRPCYPDTGFLQCQVCEPSYYMTHGTLWQMVGSPTFMTCMAISKVFRLYCGPMLMSTPYRIHDQIDYYCPAAIALCTWILILYVTCSVVALVRHASAVGTLPVYMMNGAQNCGWCCLGFHGAQFTSDSWRTTISMAFVRLRSSSFHKHEQQFECQIYFCLSTWYHSQWNHSV